MYLGTIILYFVVRTHAPPDIAGIAMFLLLSLLLLLLLFYRHEVV